MSFFGLENKFAIMIQTKCEANRNKYKNFIMLLIKISIPMKDWELYATYIAINRSLIEA